MRYCEKSPRIAMTVPDTVAAVMSDACTSGEPSRDGAIDWFRFVQNSDPLEPVDIWRTVLNQALFATQVEESSYREGSDCSRANTSTAEAVVNEPRVVAVTVEPAVAEIAVTMPRGALLPEPLMKAVCSA